MLWKGKSKFYKEFMKNLIIDILSIMFAGALIIGMIIGIVYIFRL